MGTESGSYPDAEKVFLEAFEGYLKGKVNDTVAYEYMRIAKAYLKKVYGIHANEDERLRQAIKEFLDIPNPSTYRNTLSALKHLFKFLSMSEYLADYKFKACMPNFDISTPDYESVLKFRDALDSDKMRFYFELGIMIAIRPEHLLRLQKRLFDTPNRMVNTWQKTFSKKNFFFSFYTEAFKPKVEAYLSTLPNPDSLLFDMPLRTVQKAFVRATQKSGVHMTPKLMRKFTTNWLRRHGMIPEDVDAITSHLPYSVVARHYIDHSRIKQEYDRAMKDLDFTESAKDA